VVRAKPANGDSPELTSSYPVKAGLGKWSNLTAPRLGEFAIADE